MSELELQSVEHYDRMDRVVQSMLKGTPNRLIAKELNMKVVEVEKYVAEWQGLARNNKYVQDRAKDALMATDQHYDMIIQRLWETVEQSDLEDNLKIKTSTLKMIADIERSRIDMLQKSGLLENQQLADQVLEAERKQELLVKILRKINTDHPEVAKWLRVELARVTGTPEATVVRA